MIPLLSVFILAASSPSLTFYPLSPRQGDVVIATLSPDAHPLSATFGGDPVVIFKYKNRYRVIFGIGATRTPGVYNLRVYFEDGSNLVSPVAIKAKSFPRLYLSIPEKLKITPEGLIVKLSAGNNIIAKTAKLSPPAPYFSEGFALPLANNRRVTSVFGETRITGQKEIRHYGVDLGARLGSAAGAINDGLVVRAYLDDIYGNTVIVDHGAGIISIYMHLDKILIKAGDQIKKGTLVGRVGKTGYAEYPHLHLSTKISGTSIDPFSLVRAFGIN